MVCNLVTYRARSAVREIGVALGFPRPLVDRVAKALETYDSVMVRRDLEADGGFAEFFRQPGEGLPARVRGGGRGGGARPGRRDGPAEPRARRARPDRRGGRGGQRAAAARGRCGDASGPGDRSATRGAARRRDGPAEHADPARRQGAALEAAAKAGGPGRAAAVRWLHETPLGADAGAIAAGPIESDGLDRADITGSDPGLGRGPTRRGSRPATWTSRTLGHARTADAASPSGPSSPGTSTGRDIGARRGRRAPRRARAADGDPAVAARRRRGRAGRHAGERRLAARGAGHGLCGGSGASRAAGAARRRAGRSPGDRPGERHAGAARPEDGSARPAEPLGPACAADAADGPGRRSLARGPRRARASRRSRGAAARRA